jgi:leader peptidase (prepilin peptidase)/N-methyltransferase
LGATAVAGVPVIESWLDSTPLLAVVAGLFGLLIGSFLNVVIYRLPRMIERGNVVGVVDWFEDVDEYVDRVVTEVDDKKRATIKTHLNAARPAFNQLVAALPDETLSRPRSRCGACGHRIGALENIPVVSYLVLRGRCSACKAHISLRYPAIELLTGILFAAVAWVFGFNAATLAGVILVGCLIALTFIDADVMLLPDAITLPLLWIGLLWSMFGGFVSLHDSLLGAVAGYLSLWSVYWLYKLATGKEGFGYGDFKLLAALGAWFGWQAILPVILLSAGVGAVVGVTLIAMGRKTMASKLPFGVYLAPAGVLMLFAGERVIEFVLPTIG